MLRESCTDADGQGVDKDGRRGRDRLLAPFMLCGGRRECELKSMQLNSIRWTVACTLLGSRDYDLRETWGLGACGLRYGVPLSGRPSGTRRTPTSDHSALCSARCCLHERNMTTGFGGRTAYPGMRYCTYLYSTGVGCRVAYTPASDRVAIGSRSSEYRNIECALQRVP